MKKLLISAAFAAMIATPALAQSYTPEFGGANVENTPRAERLGGDSYARAFAFAPREHVAPARHWRGESARAEQTDGNNSYARSFGFAPPRNADETY
jgi:hypothetical protein